MLNLLPPELVEPNVMYTLTLNVKQSALDSNKLKDLRKCYVKWITKSIHPYVLQVTGVFEISKNGKFYFHGTIVFNSYIDILLFYNRCYTHTGMHIEIDSISDITIWMNYMFKQGKYHNAYRKSLHIEPVYAYPSLPITDKQ